MKLLISNDDGIFALRHPQPRQRSRHRRRRRERSLSPDRERSATGQGLTMHQPIRAEIIESVFDPAIKAWACSGDSRRLREIRFVGFT